jgi:hypothetical protein
MYETEWQAFVDGAWNVSDFVRALVAVHGLSKQQAEMEFSFRWGEPYKPQHYDTTPISTLYSRISQGNA